MPLKIGLLMIRDENDILEHMLARNSEIVDHFYVLDGSYEHEESLRICARFEQFGGTVRDWVLRRFESRFSGRMTDGHRQFLYEWAAKKHGADHWFLILHGDEEWAFDPDEVIAEHPEADGFEFRLPFAFPRRWDPARSAHDQLTEFMVPGWPEFRMFRGGPGVYFDSARHFCTTPYGLKNVVRIEDKPILHYLYRSPEVQYDRAAKRKEWSPENWQDLERLGPFWDDERIEGFCYVNEHYTHSEQLRGL